MPITINGQLENVQIKVHPSILQIRLVFRNFPSSSNLKINESRCFNCVFASKIGAGYCRVAMFVDFDEILKFS